MLSRALLIASSFAFAGCFQPLSTTQGEKLRLPSGKRSALTAVDVGSDKATASINITSQETVTVEASATSELAGASISVSPDTFRAPTSLVIEAGVLLSETSVTSEVALAGDVTVQSASSGVIVRPSENVSINSPLTIALPLPTTLGFKLATTNYAVYYKYLDPNSGELQTGIKQVDDVTTVLRFDESTQKDVLQFQGYFGSYWVVTLSRPLEAAEIPTPKITQEPVVNKAQTIVIGSAGVVNEKKVLETQALPNLTLQKPLLTLDAGTRLVTINLPGSPRVASCKADLFEKITDVSGSSFEANAQLALETKLQKAGAHTLVGRFRCLDEQGKNVTSPWSDSLPVPEYTFTLVQSIDSSLTNGRYTIDQDLPLLISFSDIVRVTGTPSVRLALGANGRDALYASGSGTRVLTFTYRIQAGDDTTDLDVLGSTIHIPAGAVLSDAKGIVINPSFAALPASSRLAGKKDIEIDGLSPSAPSSVGFATTFTASMTFPVSWSAGSDRNLQTHRVKLCTASNCTTGCSTPVNALNSPLTMTAVANGSYHACVQAVDAAGLASAWAPSLTSLTVDTTPLTITGVSSSKANGIYKAGEVIPISVSFNQNVVVTQPSGITLLLETGATDRSATYQSGAGTSAILFHYTVQAGDTTNDLNYVSTNALSLSGGAQIKNMGGESAILTLPTPISADSLATQKAIVIDTTSPTAPSNVAFPSAMSNALTADIAWTLSSDANFATHNIKMCTANDCATGCISAMTSVSSPTFISGVNGSVYYGCVQGQDSAGQTSAWTASVSTIKFDTTTPSVVSVSSSHPDGPVAVGTVIPITIVFSETVYATNTVDLSLQLETGPIDRLAQYVSGSMTNTLTFQYTVQNGDLSSDLNYVGTSALSVGTTGVIMDEAGNSATLTLPGLSSALSLAGMKAIEIGGAGPTITNVTSSAVNGIYGPNFTIPIQVMFSQAVTVTGGVPNLVLNTTPLRTAAYVSGSGTNILTFNYNTQTTDLASDLDYSATTSLLLSGSLIRNAALTDATVTLPAPGIVGSLGINKNIEIAGNSQPPSLVATPSTQNSFTGTSITFDVNDQLNSNDFDVDGHAITYSCQYDLNPNSILDGGTDCANLPSTTVSFNSTTGVLNWSPSSSAVPNFSTRSSYEFFIKGQDITQLEHAVYVVVNLLKQGSASINFDAGTAGSYTYDSNLIDFSGGYARLAPMDQTDDDYLAQGFGPAQTMGASWVDGENIVRLGTFGGCMGLTQNCFALDTMSWMPAIGTLHTHYSFEANPPDFTPKGGFSSPVSSTTNKQVGAKGLNFDGITHYATIPRKVETDFTINLWVKSTQTTTTGSCDQWGQGASLISGDVSGDYPDYGISFCDGYILAGTGAPNTTLKSAQRINDYSWHMVTFTRTMGTGQIALYIDGYPSANATGGTATLSAPSGLDIGGAFGTNLFQGTMDELTFWTSPLTEFDVVQIYDRQASRSSGFIVSRVMDASSPVPWDGLSWSTTKPFGKELPDYTVGVQNETPTDYPGIGGSGLMNGVVGFWHLNETTVGNAPGGKDLVDSSPSGNHANLVGTVGLGKKGRLGKALSFDSNSSVNIGLGSSLSFGTGSFTGSFWIKPKLGNSGRIFSSGYVSGSNGVRVELMSSGKIGFGVGCGGGAASQCTMITTTGTFTDGLWHNLIVTKDSATNRMKIYVDGVPQSLLKDSTGTCGILESGNQDLNISTCPGLNASRSSSSVYFGSLDGISENYTGMLDEVAFWNRNINASEIENVYRRGANRVLFQVQSCTTPTCADGVWKGPDNSGKTFFSEIHNNTVPLTSTGSVKITHPSLIFSNFGGFTLPSYRYFRYRAVLESDDINSRCVYGNCSPEIRAVTIAPTPRFPTSTPIIQYNNPTQYYNLSGFTEIATCSGVIRYLLSGNNSSWYYWNGTAWVLSNSSYAQATPAGTININAMAFAQAAGRVGFFVKALLPSSGGMNCALDSIQITINNSH